MRLLAAARLKRATGVYLGDEKVVATTLALTPFGVQVAATHVVELDETKTVDGALAELREAKRLPGIVVCGVDARRTFLTTRLLPEEERHASARTLLGSRFSHFEGGVVGASHAVKMPDGMRTTLIACSKRTAVRAMEGMKGISPGRQRLAALPVALFALAAKAKRRSRRARTEIRVMLGNGQGLAVLAFAGTPIALSMFDCPADRRVEAIELAVLQLAAQAREEQGLKGVDLVYLHAGVDQKKFAERCELASGVKTLAAPEVALDATTAAHALALDGLRPPRNPMNMFAEIRTDQGLLENFPVRAAAALILVLGGTSAYLGYEASLLEDRFAQIKEATVAKAQSVGVKLTDLEGRHELLRGEYKNAEAFIVDRVFWSSILEELPELVPGPMELSDLDGRDRVVFPSKRTSSLLDKPRQLTIAGKVVIEPGETSPPELEELTTNLARATSLAGPFPRISNSNLRLIPGVKVTRARLLVACSP